LNLNDIPEDSILRHWAHYLNATEVPFAFQLAGGLSLIGAMIRRNRWINQIEWKVFPNQSVMYIGPSGIGKDTIINRVQRSVELLQVESGVPIVGGTTFENITARMVEMPQASVFIPAGEMADFFGKTDYKEGMLTGVTNLLSGNDKVDITTKGAYERSKGEHGQNPGKPKIIIEPTVTMHTGSTVEWLHKSMPSGTLEGGFMGRFLIVVEEIGTKYIPLVGADRTKEEIADLHAALKKWNDGLRRIIEGCRIPHEVILFEEAEHLYTNWYYNRFKQFSKAVAPYANRSRDMVLRLAMLMAMSRGHLRWIEGVDMRFALAMIRDVSARIDRVVLPPTDEARVAQKVIDMLPSTQTEIYGTLAMRYGSINLTRALELLRLSSMIVTDPKTGMISKKEPE
jgi:hypothetical protein